MASVLLLNNATATNSAPSAATDGASWQTALRCDEAYCLIRSRAGSGTMTGTFKLWGYFPVKSRAFGTITCDSRTALTDGQLVTISYGTGNSKVFEIDKAGNGVTAGNVQVDISAAADTADGTATVLAAAIRGANTPTWRVGVVGAGTSSPLTIYTDGPPTNLLGTAGNVTITETLGGAGAVTGFTGAIDGFWAPLGTNATAASKGLINVASAIGETGTDSIAHAEIITGLQGCSRVYLEITAIGGTATAFDAWLAPRGE